MRCARSQRGKRRQLWLWAWLGAAQWGNMTKNRSASQGISLKVQTCAQLFNWDAKASEKMRNEKWDMRGERERERTLRMRRCWKIENRKWIYYDIRKTRKLWKPNVWRGRVCEGQVQMRTRRTKLIFKIPPRPKNKKERKNKEPQRSPNKYAACSHAHPRPDRVRQGRARERARQTEREVVRALARSLEQQCCLIRHFLNSGNRLARSFVVPELKRSTIGTLDQAELLRECALYICFPLARALALSLSLTLSDIIQRRRPPYAKDLFLGAIHRRCVDAVPKVGRYPWAWLYLYLYLCL